MQRPARLFISYAHADTAHRQRLDAHLEPMTHEQVIDKWDDCKIEPGAKWSAEIGRRLKGADVVLLLVSADYVKSDYCRKELALALKRHAQNKSKVIPVYVEPVDLGHMPLANLQGLSQDKPVSLWKNKNAAWQHVVQELRKLLTKEQGASLAPRPKRANKSHAASTRPKRGPKRRILKIILDVDFDSFAELQEKLFAMKVAQYLVIDPESVQVITKERGSVRLTVALPSHAADALIRGFQNHNVKLKGLIEELAIVDIQPSAEPLTAALSGTKFTTSVSADVVKTVPLFARMPERAFDLVVSVSRARRFEARQVVVTTGQPGSALYCVLRGLLKVTVVRGPDEASSVVAMLGPGDIFGETALLRSTTQETTVTALSECDIIAIENADVRRLLRVCPSLITDLLRIMAQRIRKLESRLLDSGVLGSDVQAAQRLHELVVRYGQLGRPGWIRVPASFSPQELSQLLQISKAHLKLWRRIGWLRLTQHYIEVRSDQPPPGGKPRVADALAALAGASSNQRRRAAG